MPTPHKHAAVIKAWANGEEIQCRFNSEDKWRDMTTTPLWHDYVYYRVKPVETTVYGILNFTGGLRNVGSSRTRHDNVKMVFLEGKLIGLEIIEPETPT